MTRGKNGIWTIRGIVSASLEDEDNERACNTNEYLMFTDVAKFADWINSKIKN